MIFISFSAIGQEKKLVWDYPVKPGLEEWKKLNSPYEIYQALQIPDKILKEIDTESLVQICLNYPATTVFFIRNTPQECFEAFYSQFNGIQELMNRKDAGKFLLSKYAQMSLADFNPLWILETQGSFVNKFYYMELFLVQPQIQELLNANEQELLLKETIKKFELKCERSDLFGGNSLEVTTWVMTKLLYTKKKLLLDEQSLSTGQLKDIDMVSIYQQAKIDVHE